MSNKDSQKEQEKKELLYLYWEKLPLVIDIEMPIEEVLSHEVRNLIIYFIRKGIEERKKDGSLKVRHAFSAKELLDYANKKMEEKMKLQSMYFHLQKMQEFGIIEVVTTLHEGRHNIAYFGRTARGFLFENPKEKNKYDQYFAEAERFAKVLNPKISEKKFGELLQEFKTINKKTENEITEWLKKKEKLINENNIDSATLFSFLRRINYNNDRMTKLMKEVADLLDYNL